MRRLLVGLALTIVVLVHALAPPSVSANWFGRCGGWYSSRHYYGYGSSYCYRPSYYYGSGYYGSPYYGYSNYGGTYGSMPYGVGGGSGFGGNSALTTLLAMGGLGGANSSMYMTVPMSNGWGPASLLQVPVGGAAGRSTYLQVPIGGGPGQPVYLQLELGGNASATPMPAPSRPLGSTVLPGNDQLTMDDAMGAATVPYVVAASSTVVRPQVAARESSSADASVADGPQPSTGPFRLAVLERERDATAGDRSPAAQSVSRTKTEPAATADAVDPLDLGPNFGAPSQRTLTDGAAPWQVK